MQKRHRIFIAINLPKEIKQVLARYEDKFKDLPAKWTKPENLHITVEFLGELYDHELGGAVARAKEIAAGLEPFDVHLNKIEYAPAGKIPPRMLWATAGNMHVTMAKISAAGWRAIEPEERPEIEGPIDLLFTVESIDLMESELGKGGPKYTILESIVLNDK